jgi:hypothetical protein
VAVFGRDAYAHLVDADDRSVHGFKSIACARDSQHEPHSRVLDDVREAVLREADIERNVGGVDLQYGQHPDVREHGIVQEERDPVTRSGALAEQIPGELIRPRVKLVVRDGDLAGIHRQMIRLTVLAQPITFLLEDVLETLPLTPADPALARRRNQDMTS